MNWIVITLVALHLFTLSALAHVALNLREAKRTIAAILDIHTTALRRDDAAIQELQKRDYPRFSSAVIPTSEFSQGAPVTPWTAHDAAVTDALQKPFHGAANAPRGAGLPDPDDAPFFTQSAPQ